MLRTLRVLVGDDEVIVLTSSEAQDLIEHLAGRPDIWLYQHDVWVRQQRSETTGLWEYLLALKLRNSLDHDMYALTSLAVTWSKQDVDDYVIWLLDKYTAYGSRAQIIQALEPVLKPTASIHLVSKTLCEIQGGTFVKRRPTDES